MKIFWNKYFPQSIKQKTIEKLNKTKLKKYPFGLVIKRLVIGLLVLLDLWLIYISFAALINTFWVEFSFSLRGIQNMFFYLISFPIIFVFILGFGLLIKVLIEKYDRNFPYLNKIFLAERKESKYYVFLHKITIIFLIFAGLVMVSISSYEIAFFYRG